ncbi:MFS transporter [Herbiconiux sp. CPCC 203407]|uniref:MFS transporter n=1 Tax=Herbiconiux oxytropis TaxID=2970915 RepID=A0AA41XI86_9MICO|nr:MFS transporter [Herbiconiux oxytropis]MCS5723032.1 MFS transporter [Herbiconiux oxytropis]MCS5726899.1 MFS transporter [Herbiconiux oxytropis]
MKRVLVFAAVNLVVLGALTAPVVTGLPLLIARLVPEGERTGVLAFVTVCGAIASVVANPLFGLASDRTPGRFGRRRPWLLGGVVLGFGATVLVLNAGSVAALAVGWVLAQTAYNASLAAVAALLGDQVEEQRRASASGIFGAAAFLGTLPPLALAALVPDRLDIVMLTMPTAALAVGFIACLVIRDTPLAQVRRTSLTGSARRLGLRGLELRRYSLFGWVWLQRFMLQLAFSLVTTFTLYFVAVRFVLSPEGASPAVAVTTLIGGAGIVLSALVTGFVASRRGRYGPFIVAASLGLAAAAALRALAPDVPVLWAGAALGGVALGAFYAVDLALALRAIPAGRSGTFLGVFNIAETIPQAIAPAVALGLLALAGPDPVTETPENYTALYLAAGGVALLALLPLPFLRPILTRAAPADPEPRVPR